MERRHPQTARPSRRRSIRTTILVLLLVPVVPLLSMWMFTTGGTVDRAAILFRSATNAQVVGQPTARLVDALQTERRLSMTWAGGRHDAATRAALAAQRSRTDAIATTLRHDTSTAASRHAATDLTRGYLGVLTAALSRLNRDRMAIDGGGRSPEAVMTDYDGFIDTALALYDSVDGAGDLDRRGATISAMMQARESFAREDAIVAGAVAANRLSDNQYTALISAIGTQRYLFPPATRFLPGAEQRRYQAILSGAAFTRLRSREDALSQRRPTAPALPVGFDATGWADDFGTVNGQLARLETTQAEATVRVARSAAVRTVVELAVAGGIGLLVVVALIIAAVRLGRDIVTRLHRLHADAIDLARHRLPSIQAHLQRGPRDPAAELPTAQSPPAESPPNESPPHVSPPVAYGTDEIGRVAAAFRRVERTAVAMAHDDAAWRAGRSEMFRTISGRSQTVLHRQLALLDEMERRVTEPDDLAALFRLDHLATRLRRHVDELTILAGAAPGREWRRPVALTDVVRAAAAEIEQYPRIAIRPLPDAAVAGAAVGDIVHLIAELLENATSFSPPGTPVTVSAVAGPDGLVIEIEDRGDGMPAAVIAVTNERLAGAPDMREESSDRLGLFVVAGLAARHAIGVRLREAPRGGVMAVVQLPIGLVVRDETESPPPLQSAPGIRALTAVGGPDRPTPAPDDADTPEEPGVPDGTRARPTRPAPRQRSLTLVTPQTPPSSPPAVPAVNADGLPQRVRPRDRDDPTVRSATGPTDANVTRAPTPRSAAEMRTMLTAFQDATLRGRVHAAADPPPADATPPDAAVPPATGSDRTISMSGPTSGKESGKVGGRTGGPDDTGTGTGHTEATGGDAGTADADDA